MYYACVKLLQGVGTQAYVVPGHHCRLAFNSGLWQSPLQLSYKLALLDLPPNSNQLRA